MDTWREKIEAAHDMISALCQPRGSEGGREWIMSIPANPERDPDLVITEGLMAAKKQIDALTAERDELRRRLDAVLDMLAHVEPFQRNDLPKEVSDDLDYPARKALYIRAKAIAEGKG